MDPRLETVSAPQWEAPTGSSWACSAHEYPDGRLAPRRLPANSVWRYLLEGSAQRSGNQIRNQCSAERCRYRRPSLPSKTRSQAE